jgi:hypothetical protein
VKLLKKLDREQDPQVSFHVIAMDDGTPQRSSTATVTVTVLDVNDNSPEFNIYQNSYSILESATNGTRIAVIDATDKDEGVFKIIEYSIQVNNDDDCLVINKLTVSVFCIVQLTTFKVFHAEHFVKLDNLCLNFFHLLARKPNLETLSIYSNEFIHNFHQIQFDLSQASGKWVSAKTG